MTRKKLSCIFMIAGVMLCGCSSKEEETNNVASATAEATVSATAETETTSNYTADDFTLTVTNKTEQGLNDPLGSINVKDPDGTTLDLTLSDTNQHATYTCDDYTLNISFSVVTDGVYEKTIIKYLIEVSDQTTSPATASSATQEETFAFLPSSDSYANGSASVNKTESSSEVTSDQNSSAIAEANKNKNSSVSDEDHSSEWGTATSDGTVCICDECGAEFPSTTAWYEHVVASHGGKASYHITSK